MGEDNPINATIDPNVIGEYEFNFELSDGTGTTSTTTSSLRGDTLSLFSSVDPGTIECLSVLLKI